MKSEFKKSVNKKVKYSTAILKGLPLLVSPQKIIYLLYYL
jgi:hypothetical protein